MQWRPVNLNLALAIDPPSRRVSNGWVDVLQRDRKVNEVSGAKYNVSDVQKTKQWVSLSQIKVVGLPILQLPPDLNLHLLGLLVGVPQLANNEKLFTLH